MIDETAWQEKLRGIFQGEVEYNREMKEITSLHIGGPADVLMIPDDPLSVRNLLELLKKEGVPILSVGGGTNLLVRDRGVEGVVLSLKKFTRIEVLKEENQEVEIFAEAGVPLQKLLHLCRERGYAGMEGLAGIPGTVGGAICGNSGSYGIEMKDVLVSVARMDASGRLERCRPEGLGLSYRRSALRAGDIILSANIRLKRDEPKAVASRTESFLSEKKRTQPIGEWSAGCVFKNPDAGVSAGRLIDEAGCKGMRIGAIAVSDLHANFFVNTGKGTAAEYLGLMQEVSSRVHRKFGINLEPEVRIVGRA